MGKRKENVKVSLDKSVRQYNPRFVNETGRTVYHNYMGGAGYAISYEVARRLWNTPITETTALPFRHFPREDMAFGLWMSGIGGLHSVLSSRSWLLAHLTVKNGQSNVRGTQYVSKASLETASSAALVPKRCLGCASCGA